MLERAALQIAPELLEVAGRLGEVRIDGIKLVHSGEVGRFALSDQRAFRDQCATDTPVDGRADTRVVEIKLYARDVRLARGDVGLRLTNCRDRDFILRLRRGLPRDQLFHPLGLLFGLIVHRLRLCKRGLGRIELDLEPDRVDAIEHIARLDVGALLKRAL